MWLLWSQALPAPRVTLVLSPSSLLHPRGLILSALFEHATRGRGPAYLAVQTHCWHKAIGAHHTTLDYCVRVCALSWCSGMGTTGLGDNSPPQLSASFKVANPRSQGLRQPLTGTTVRRLANRQGSQAALRCTVGPG
jgi:hypothetical protein